MKNWLRRAKGSWEIRVSKKVIRVQAISSPPPFVFQHEMTRAGRMKCNAHRADVWNCQVYALFPDACASAQVLPPVLLNACLNELLIFNKIQTNSEHKRPVKGNIPTYKNPAMETLCTLNDPQTLGMSRVHYICNRKRNTPYSTWTCYVSNNSDKTPLLFTRNLSKWERLCTIVV